VNCVLGHRGLVGSAIARALNGDCVTADGVDLTDLDDLMAWWESHTPSHVYLAAARVGGIEENAQEPAKFIRENLLIATNVTLTANLFGCDRLLFLGSSCIYPREAPQPIPESALMTGPLEETNRAYAVAKIAGLELVRAHRRQYGRRWISVMPCNVYGPGDRSTHVIPMLMRRFHKAKVDGADEVSVWGSGKPRREFIHADDLARACLHVMRDYDDDEPINVGWGIDYPIVQVALMLRDIVGFRGRVVFDQSKPDGTPRKVLDIRKMAALGFLPTIGLQEGLERTYREYVEEQS